MRHETARRHLSILSTAYIVLGGLGLLAAIVTLIAVVGGGALSGDPEARAVTSLVGPLVAAFLALLSLPSVIAGIGLLQRRPWARVLALVLGALHLFNFPVGTALGVYTFWFLLQEDAYPLFSPPRRQIPIAP